MAISKFWKIALLNLIPHAYYHFMSIIHWNLIKICCYPLVISLMTYSIIDIKYTRDIKRSKNDWIFDGLCSRTKNIIEASCDNVLIHYKCWYVLNLDKTMKIMISLPVRKDHDLLAYYSNNMKKTKKDFNNFNHVYTLNFDMQRNTS